MSDDAEELVRAAREAAVSSWADLFEKRGLSREEALAEARKKLGSAEEPREHRNQGNAWSSFESSAAHRAKELESRDLPKDEAIAEAHKAAALAQARHLLGLDRCGVALRAVWLDARQRRREHELARVCEFLRGLRPRLKDLKRTMDSDWGFQEEPVPLPGDLRETIANAWDVVEMREARASQAPQFSEERKFMNQVSRWAKLAEALTEKARRLSPKERPDPENEGAALAREFAALGVSPRAAAFLEIANGAPVPVADRKYSAEDNFEKQVEKWKKAIARARDQAGKRGDKLD